MTTFFQLMFKRTVIRQLTRWVVTVAVVAAIATGAYFAWQRYSVPQLNVTDVVEGPVVQAFYATGTLLPHREYPVKSNVEGTLVEVLVDKGSEVKQGEMLARVYVEEYELKRTQAEAELELVKQLVDPETSPALKEFDSKIEAAQKQLETATKDYERLAQIRNTGGRTIAELEKAEEISKTTRNTLEALKSAKATKLLEFQRDLKTAQVQFDIAQWNIDQQSIKSPTDGFVLDWPVAAGTRVKMNDTLMTVADVRYDHLIMRTNADEEDKTRVRLDQTVQITLYSYANRVFEGRVKRVYPKADPLRRTFEVDVQILEPDQDFAAGMTGELAFVVARKEQAIVVPSQAVQSGQIWIVRDGRLAQADVKLGLRSIQRTEILAGLAPGEQVVISPISNFKSGREVRTVHIHHDAAAVSNDVKAQPPSSFKGMK